jgi:hypothetical protein
VGVQSELWGIQLKGSKKLKRAGFVNAKGAYCLGLIIIFILPLGSKREVVLEKFKHLFKINPCAHN